MNLLDTRAPLNEPTWLTSTHDLSSLQEARQCVQVDPCCAAGRFSAIRQMTQSVVPEHAGSPVRASCAAPVSHPANLPSSQRQHRSSVSALGPRTGTPFESLTSSRGWVTGYRDVRVPAESVQASEAATTRASWRASALNLPSPAPKTAPIAG